MNSKLLAGGALSAALALFVWGAMAHMMLPIPEPVTPFKDGQAILNAIRAQAPHNGMYYEPRGILVAVALTPDLADKTQAMGPNLGVEFVTNVIGGVLLTLLLAWSRAKSALGHAAIAGMIGLAGFIVIDASYWNWYGFSTPFTLQNFCDAVPGTFLAGLAAHWAVTRMKPAA